MNLKNLWTRFKKWVKSKLKKIKKRIHKKRPFRYIGDDPEYMVYDY